MRMTLATSVADPATLDEVTVFNGSAERRPVRPYCHVSDGEYSQRLAFDVRPDTVYLSHAGGCNTYFFIDPVFGRPVICSAGMIESIFHRCSDECVPLKELLVNHAVNARYGP
jgi:hypothetical protein